MSSSMQPAEYRKHACRLLLAFYTVLIFVAACDALLDMYVAAHGPCITDSQCEGLE